VTQHGHGDGDRDQRDGEEHGDGSPGDEGPRNNREDDHCAGRQQPQELPALDLVPAVEADDEAPETEQHGHGPPELARQPQGREGVIVGNGEEGFGQAGKCLRGRADLDHEER